MEESGDFSDTAGHSEGPGEWSQGGLGPPTLHWPGSLCLLMGDVQNRKTVFADTPTGPCVNKTAHFGEQLLALLWLDQAMIPKRCSSVRRIHLR